MEAPHQSLGQSPNWEVTGHAINHAQSAPDIQAPLRRDLDELVKAGLITRQPGGRYTLTPAGREALKAGEHASP